MSKVNVRLEDAAACPAYVLAGGRSRRFGQDKARVLIEGRPQIARITAGLGDAGHNTFVVADRVDRFADLGIKALVDAQPDAGPMAALATALQHRTESAGQGWLLLVSCDQWRWLPSWFAQLWAGSMRASAAVTFASRNSVEPGSTAVAEVFFEPLPALYHTDLLEPVRRQLDSQPVSREGTPPRRQFSLRHLLKQLSQSPSLSAKRIVVGLDEADLHADWVSPRAWTFNTQAELDRLQ